jgi:ABC-type Fe3+-hydroxamate transport system substrate-binding protein
VAALPRVVSLVPSHTETLAALGADLVGVTRYCTEPADLRDRVAVVGGTKDPDVDAIVALAPDVVVVNREENRAEDADALTAAGCELLATFPTDVDSGVDTVELLGGVTGTADTARRLATDLRARLDVLRTDVAARVARAGRPAVFVAIWWRPLMSVNVTTYAHSVLHEAGATNVCADHAQRYCTLDGPDAVRQVGSDLALLPDEPFVFGDRHVGLFRDAGVDAVRCSGQDLHWYGPRAVDGVRRIAALVDSVRT